MGAICLDTLRVEKTFFFNLEKVVSVQRQIGYAVEVLQKFQIFYGNFLKELFQQTADM